MHDGQPVQSPHNGWKPASLRTSAMCWAAGYRVLGPTVGDGAIVHGEVRSPNDLPRHSR